MDGRADRHADRATGEPGARRTTSRAVRAASEPSQVAAVKALQRSIGNRATERLLRAPGPPSADAAPSRPLSRQAAFVYDVRRLLDVDRADVPPRTDRARQIARPSANGGPAGVQRVVSKAQFIEDTTSYFIFNSWSWRKGTDDDRTKVEGLLDVYEQAQGTIAQVNALTMLTTAARMIRTTSTKFQSALDKIVKEGNELRFALEDTKEWKEHDAALKKEKEEKAKAERDEKRKQELAVLGQLDWDGRVAAFKKKFGAGALFETLIGGTKDLKGTAQLLRLTQNFKNIGFKYTMRAVASKELLGGRTDGDCSTVAGAMATIVQEVFLTDAEVNGCKELVVDSTEKTIDAGKTPSAEGGAYWIFNDHYWVESSHGNFDPLFGRVKNEDGWYPIKKQERNGELKLDVEDYGGGFVIVALITDGGLLNKRASMTTREEWAQHMKQTKVTATFEEFREAVGVR